MGSSKKQTIGYRYFMGLHFGLCHGPVDSFLELRGGDRTAWQGNVTSSGSIYVNAPELWGGERKEGGIAGTLDVMMGEATQAPNSYLVSQLGTPMPAFRGMLSLVFRKGMVGAMNPYPKPWKFKLRRSLEGWHGGVPWYPEKAPVPVEFEAFPGDAVTEQTIISLPLNGAGGETDFTDAMGNTWYRSASTSEDNTRIVGGAAYFSGRFDGDEGSYLKSDDPLGLLNEFTIRAEINPDAGEYTQLRTIYSSDSGFLDIKFGVTPESKLFAQRDSVFSLTGDITIPAGAWTDVAIRVANGVAQLYVNEEPDGEGPSVPSTAEGVFLSAIGRSREGQHSYFVGSIRKFTMTGPNPGPTLLAQNPAHITYEALTNPDWGLGYPAGVLDLDSFAAAADVFYAEGLGLCLQWTRQDSIEGFIQDVMNHAGAVLAQDPRTALFRLLPIRADYVVADLPEFRRGLNVIAVENFERAALTETVNEVTVQYVDALTGKDGSVTVQHLANIQSQGGVASQSIRYPGAPTQGLAQRLAMRDLDAKSRPLCKVRLIVDRSGYGILPGQVVRWSDTKLGIVDMAMRVLQVNYGDLTSGAIQLDLAEDVFGMPETAYLGQQPDGWEEPSTAPQAPPAVDAFELPYVAIHRAEGATVANALDPSSGFLGMVATRPAGVSFGFALYTRVGSAEYEETGTGEWAPGGALTAGIGPEDTVLALGDTFSLATVVAGDLAMLGEGDEAELLRITAVDVGANTVTVARGCGDTVPPEAGWPIGTRLWVLEDALAASVTEYGDGETVDAKAVTQATGGTLPLWDAPLDSVTMDQRHARPYPPGLFAINGQSTPSVLDGDLTVTWAHRDRLLQADQLVGQGEASIGPEPGTTYTMRTYLEDALVNTQTGIAGDSATVEPPGNGVVRIELEAVRDGLTSWHMQSRTFGYTIGPANNRVTVAGDRRVTVAGVGRISIG